MSRHGLRIGFSANFFHADPQRALFKGKTLTYIEQDIVSWVMAEGALTYLITAPTDGHPVDLEAYATDLDGLILQGGADVAPPSYGEEAERPEWAGDAVRDAYELELIAAFRELNKPILGVCRGRQILNVACGGTLVQDIQTHVPNARRHRDWDVYDRNIHEIVFAQGGRMASLYPGQDKATVTSVHHQCIKRLGDGLRIEAHCPDDGIIEAISYDGPSWVFGVQWHPEWHTAEKQLGLLNSEPFVHAFLKAAHHHRTH